MVTLKRFKPYCIEVEIKTRVPHISSLDTIFKLELEKNHDFFKIKNQIFLVKSDFFIQIRFFDLN